jgi:hypothetical protein
MKKTNKWQAVIRGYKYTVNITNTSDEVNESKNTGYR